MSRPRVSTSTHLVPAASRPSPPPLSRARRRAYLGPRPNKIVQFLLERVLRPRRAFAFVAHVRGVAPQRLFAQFLRAHLSRRLARVDARVPSPATADSTTRVVRRAFHRSRARVSSARARRRVGHPAGPCPMKMSSRDRRRRRARARAHIDARRRCHSEKPRVERSRASTWE